MSAAVGSQVAAIDLGSNSFHMVVAQIDEQQRLRVLDRMKERVRIAGGLEDKRISLEAEARALACLARFGERIAEIPHTQVRAVGTDTFRRARNGEDFLRKARLALGHSIEIVSGQEEARLVYQGVDQSVDPPQADRRVVVDIGGGSTEVITGNGPTPGLGRSLHMGCVSWSRKFFADGRITQKGFKEAMGHASQLLGRVSRDFRAIGWDHALGSSGTIKAIERILLQEGISPGGITRPALKKLRQELISAGHVEALQLQGLSPERAQVLPGGLAILSAVFAELPIEHMVASPTALREGLLQDLLGRLYGHDLREASVQHLMERLQVDTAQAARVAQWSLAVFDQLQSSLDLRPRQRRLLRWAALLHEVGQFISFSGYQRHGAYILESGELPGFSLQDRHALALLVRLQRGKLKSPPMDGLREHQPRLLACVRILRLSVLLHRRRSPKPLPVPKVRVKGETMTLAFPEGFLEHRAMSRDGLAHERKRQGAAGLSLVFG